MSFSAFAPPSIPGVPPIQAPLKIFSVPTAGGSSLAPSPAVTSFTQVLANMGQQTRDTLVRAEHMSKAAAAGEADPQVVAMSVVNASATVKQFSTLLNAATRAFQELMHTAM